MRKTNKWGCGFGEGDMYALLGLRVGFIALFAVAIDVVDHVLYQNSRRIKH